MKKIIIKDHFDSKYSPSFFELRILFPDTIRYFVQTNDMEFFRFSLKNIVELVSFHMGVYGFLSYFMVIVFSLCTFVIMGLTYYYRNHPYLKAISPIFCIIILFGYLLNVINILMLLPPYSVLKCKVSYVSEMSNSFVLIPMFAVTYRIYRIFKSKIIITKALDNIHLLIYICIALILNLIYKIIITLVFDFQYLSSGYFNDSLRLPIFIFQHYKTFDLIDSIYYFTL
eukprot:jgi/Orpsp1_1/1177921/evm.model.c7180000063338.1